MAKIGAAEFQEICEAVERAMFHAVVTRVGDAAGRAGMLSTE
jgi:hypothetical protein